MRAEIRQENNRYIKSCKQQVTRSKLPDQLKATLHYLLEYMGSATDYTKAWVSAKSTATIHGKSSRTIERHIQTLRDLGLIIRETRPVAEVREILKKDYNYTLRTNNQHTHMMSLTSINKAHPFWQGLAGDVYYEKVRGTLKQIRKGRGVAVSEGLPEGQGKREYRHRRRENTVTRDTRIPSQETPQIPSHETEKLSYVKQGAHTEDQTASDQDTQQGVTPDFSVTMSQKEFEAVRPSDRTGKGGFDVEEGATTPCQRPAVAEGRAGSPPLGRAIKKVDSHTHTSEIHTPAESEDDTVLEDYTYTSHHAVEELLALL